MEQQNDELMEMEQQNGESMEVEIVNDIVFSHRQRSREYKDLEDRFSLVYKFIEQNYLLLGPELNKEKNKFELKLEDLKYTNLTLIEELEVKGEQVDYETELKNYKSLRGEIRVFTAKVYDVYLSTIANRFDQDRAFKRYMALYAQAQKTPELSTQTWLTNALDDAYLREATQAGLIDKKQADALRKQAMEIRMLNEQKAKQFYKITEQLKKEKGEN